MATKKVGYKEPKDYFTPEMLKVAKQWEKDQKAKQSKGGKKSK